LRRALLVNQTKPQEIRHISQSEPFRNRIRRLLWAWPINHDIFYLIVIGILFYFILFYFILTVTIEYHEFQQRSIISTYYQQDMTSGNSPRGSILHEVFSDFLPRTECPQEIFP
jgi:hypothetical protein